MTEKVYIAEDELYPYFSAGTDPGHFEVEADLPDGFMARYEAVMAQFDALQDEMQAAYTATRSDQR